MAAIDRSKVWSNSKLRRADQEAARGRNLFEKCEVTRGRKLSEKHRLLIFSSIEVKHMNIMPKLLKD